MNYNEQHAGIHIFNLGSGTGQSVLDVITAFKKASNKDIPFHFAPRRAGDLAAYWANADKAKQILGWQTKLNLQDMVKDSWNWQSKNPKGFI